ncbi:MAG: dihydrofolate reductase [Nanoarchaeota archaeon]|nr:dihydrofolate reductase [Nanoarchaeota archaeon]
MNLTIIAAVAENRVIGNKGKVPWHISEDLKRFKKLTSGHPVIMGRKTYESILEGLGHSLENRTNIVLSRNDQKLPGIVAANSIEDAIRKASEYDETAYVIGGQSIYEQTIGLADRMELTEVKGGYEGDAFFPVINYDEWNWTSISHMEDYDFVTYTRKR